MEQPENPKNDLEKAKEIIRNCRKSIEAEFERSKNPWPACFRSQLFGVSGFIQMAEIANEVSPDYCRSIIERVKILDEKNSLLFKEYPNKELMPPEEEREELLKELESILDV